MNLLNKAKNNIIIIDNYANKDLYDIIRNLKTNVYVYSANLNEDLINKYQKQYTNLKAYTNTKFHDRFIIIDKRELYLLGTSFNSIGKKCSSIIKIENEEILNKILDNLEA